MSSLTLEDLKKAATFGRPGIQVISVGRHLQSNFAVMTKQNASDRRHWLPLAISNGHWLLVREEVYSCLQALKVTPALPYKSVTDMQVLYQFACDIIGKFGQLQANGRAMTQATLRNAVTHTTKSFYQVVQLMLCLACDNKLTINQADHMIGLAMDGRVHKGYIRNLAHIFMATIVSEVPLINQAKKSLVKEAITRNVIWALQEEPGLEYMEPDAVSPYRLKRTFQISDKNYRYLLLCDFFAKAARPKGMEIEACRDRLMETCGLPTSDQISAMTDAVATANKVASFPDLLTGFGFGVLPTSENFTTVLRGTVKESYDCHYCRPALSQEDALKVRLTKEPRVGVAPQ